MLQSQESDVLSYSECKMAKFSGPLPLDPTWKGLQHPSDSSTVQWFFSSLPSSKNWHCKKITGYGTDQMVEIWQEVILTIQTFFKTKNNIL